MVNENITQLGSITISNKQIKLILRRKQVFNYSTASTEPVPRAKNITEILSFFQAQSINKSGPGMTCSSTNTLGFFPLQMLPAPRKLDVTRDP